MDPKDELKTRIKQLIVKQLKLEIDPASIGDDAPLFGDAANGLGLDSIDALELVLGVEKEFGIKVQDEEVGVKAFASVDALYDFIRRIPAQRFGTPADIAPFVSFLCTEGAAYLTGQTIRIDGGFVG